MYTLPNLPYKSNALEPIISEKIMNLHHDKHHSAYVNNVNKALAETGLKEMPIENILKNLDKVPEKIRTTVRNNGGGHANHSLFWTIMQPPTSSNNPEDSLMEKIIKTFGSYEEFQKKFAKIAMAQFGSGWAWLVQKPDKSLGIYSTSNQDSPISQGDTPLLGLDIWEHAYYLDYLNDRSSYVQAWWQVINWKEVENRMN